MDVEDSKDGVVSKDFNIDNMLNNSKGGFANTSRRKKSWCSTEGNTLVNRIAVVNKTHDYHNSTANIHSSSFNLLQENSKNLDHGEKRVPAQNKSVVSNVPPNIFSNLKKVPIDYRQSRSSQRYANALETPEELKHSKIFKTDQSIVLGHNLEDSFDNDCLQISSATDTLRRSQITPMKRNNDIHKKVMALLDDEEEDNDYIRPDEEIMITPSTEEKGLSYDFQDALNKQSESIEKPLKRVSKLSKSLDKMI